MFWNVLPCYEGCKAPERMSHYPQIPYCRVQYLSIVLSPRPFVTFSLKTIVSATKQTLFIILKNIHLQAVDRLWSIPSIPDDTLE